MRISAGSILLCFLFIFNSGITVKSQKINGINFVGSPYEVEGSHFDPIIELGANYVCFVPFAYGQDNEATLRFKDLDWQWWGESLEGVEECIIEAHAKGLKTIVKPQVWFRHGSFTGHFNLTTEEDWTSFENDYKEYILRFAELSEELGVELFCIGTEFCNFVRSRPQFWSDLITQVRNIYSGKLTYASNWDSFEEFPHWDKLDLIGIDAYFPLTKQSTPKFKTLLASWQSHYNRIYSLSQKMNTPVLFTEFGYRSVDYCARSPWLSDRSGNVNLEAQYNAFNAIFTRFWEEDWFAGGLLWKWYPRHAEAGGELDNRFTPQNKPAENLIRKWYREL